MNDMIIILMIIIIYFAELSRSNLPTSYSHKYVLIPRLFFLWTHICDTYERYQNC